MITCVVDYDPFAMDSRITLIKDEDSNERYQGCSNLPELAETLQSFSHQYGFNKVMIHAPEHIFEELNRITNTNFTDNKLELEII